MQHVVELIGVILLSVYSVVAAAVGVGYLANGNNGHHKYRPHNDDPNDVMDEFREIYEEIDAKQGDNVVKEPDGTGCDPPGRFGHAFREIMKKLDDNNGNKKPLEDYLTEKQKKELLKRVNA